jgi:hypothetical protein
MDNNGADIVHVQRYVGHEVPTMMHRVYSDGASRIDDLLPHRWKMADPHKTAEP